MTRRLTEAFVFLSIAAIIHLALWWRMPEGTLTAAGDGGDAAISIAAATPRMVEMIEAFDTPPDQVDSLATQDLLDAVAPPAESTVPSPASPADTAARPTAARPLPKLDKPGVGLPSMEAPPPPPEAPEVVEAPVLTLNPETRPPETALPSADAAFPRPESSEHALLSAPARPTLPPPPSLAPPPQPEADSAEPTSPRPLTRPDRPAPPIAPAEPRREAAPAAPPPQQDAIRSDRPQAGQAEQRAAGAGGGQAAGSTGQSENAGLSPARRENLLANWGSKIRSRVERRKSHPPGLRSTGTATVRLVVTTEGQLATFSLVHSSGIPALDEAALNAVRRAGRFAKAPRALGRGQHSFTLPIRFEF